MNPLNIAANRVANLTTMSEFMQLVGIYRLLGVAYGCNLNALNTDTPVPLNLIPQAAAGVVNYKVLLIDVNNASLSMTTAQAAVYTGPGATGTNLAAAQALSSLTASTSDLAMTLAAGATGNIQTANTLYFRCTTAQGAAATADVYVWGVVLP